MIGAPSFLKGWLDREYLPSKRSEDCQMCRVQKFIFKEHLKYNIEENSEPDTIVDDNYESIRIRENIQILMNIKILNL